MLLGLYQTQFGGSERDAVFFPQHLRSRIFALETIWKESFVRVLGLG